MRPLSLLFLFLLLISIRRPAVGDLAAKDHGGGVVAAGTPLWCVAKNNAEDAALQSALDWACGPGGADCSPIQNGGPCFELSDVQPLASFAFNDYFRRGDSVLSDCGFAGAGALTSLDPSHGDCHFASSSSPGNGSFIGSTTAGLGPNGTDISGIAALACKSWTRVVPLSLLILATLRRHSYSGTKYASVAM